MKKPIDACMLWARLLASSLTPCLGQNVSGPDPGAPAIVRMQFDMVTCLGFSPDGARLAIGGRVCATNVPAGEPPILEKRVGIWDLARQREILSVKVGKGLTGAGWDTVKAVTFNPKEQVLATVTSEGIKLWSAESGRELHVLAGYGAGRGTTGAGLGGAAFSPDGRLLSTRWDSSVQMWDWRETRSLWRTNLYGGSAFGFSPDGRWLVAGELILDATSGAQCIRIPVNGVIDSISFHPHGQWLAGTGNIRPTVWEFGSAGNARLSPTPRFELTGHAGGARAIAFSPDGRVLATVGNLDQACKLWDAPSGRPLTTLATSTTGREEPAAMAFAPDGKLLAIASTSPGRAAVVQLWNVSQILQPAVVSAWSKAAAQELVALVREKDAAATPLNRYLAALGPYSKEALPVLLEGLKAKEPTARRVVLMALGQLGPEAHSAVSTLAEVLRHDEHIEVRQGVIALLLQWGSAALPAVPALLEASEKDPNSAVRALAAMAMRQVAPESIAKAEEQNPSKVTTQTPPTVTQVTGLYEGMPLSYWVGKLGQSYIPNEILGRSDRSGPLRAIRSFPTPVAVQALANTLSSQSWYQRVAAAELLGEYGADARSALPALVRAMGGADWEKRVAAERTGAWSGTGAPRGGGLSTWQAVVLVAKTQSSMPPELLQALESRNPVLRFYAAAAIARLDPTNTNASPAAASALAELRRVTTSNLLDVEMSWGMSQLLSEFQPPASGLASELLASRPSFTDVKSNLLHHALRLGSPSAELPALLARACEPGIPDSERAQLDEVIRAAGVAAVPLILDRLKTDPFRSLPVQKHLTNYPVVVLPLMIPLVSQTNRPLAGRAVAILIGMGPAARGVVPKMLELLQHPDPAVRARAARFLGFMAHDAEASIPALRRMLEDPEPGPRFDASNSLQRLQGQAPTRGNR